MDKRLPLGCRLRCDGRLELRFKLNGRSYSVYGQHPNEIRQKELRLREEIEKGLYNENRDITLSKYFEEYIQAKSGAVKEATILHNRSTFKRIDKEFGKMKIRKIETRQINAFRQKLEQELHDESSKLTTHGANNVLELLTALLESAMHDAVIMRNPAAGVKKFKRIEEDVRETIHRRLTNEELRMFFAVAEVSFYKYLFEFMLATGVRVGEALALYWTDINFDTGEIRIMRSVTKAVGGGVKIGDTAKTAAGKRTIYMNNEIRRILEEQRKILTQLFGADVIGLVFPSSIGGVARPSSVDTCMKSMCRTADMRPFTSHAFRHTFASNMVDAGVKPEVLKTILGHTNIKVTMDTYYHADSDRMREAMGNVITFREASNY